MANAEINDLTGKTTPVSTDEVEIQETAGGTSKKATLGNLSKAITITKSQVSDFSDGDYATAAQGSKADSALQNVSGDTNPTLGGDLNAGTNDITNAGLVSASDLSATDDIAGSRVIVDTVSATGGYDLLTLAETSITTSVNIEMTASQTVDGRDVSADGSKLDGIATDATANDTDANLKNRANHTGTQTMSTISDAGDLATQDTVNNSDWSGTDLSVANGGTGASTHTSGNYLKGNGTGAITSESLDDLAIAVGGIFFPVGRSIMWTSTNPGSSIASGGLGFGTWTRIEGKFIVGVDDGDGDFDLDDTGGDKTHSHPLSDNGQAKAYLNSTGLYVERNTSDGFTANRLGTSITDNSSSASTTGSINLQGDTDSADGLPPFVAKYIWQRTA